MGVVLDSATRTPLQNVSVSLINSGQGSLTGSEGKFRIRVTSGMQKILFTAMGYRPLTVTVEDSSGRGVMVYLARSYMELEDFVISKRKKYRNKNNPAVELIRKVIANKSKNGPGAYPYLSYLQYEKIRGLTDKRMAAPTRMGPLKKYRFFFENMDTTLVPGKALSSVYLSEMVSKYYYRRQPEKSKQVILSRKSVDFGEFIDTRGINGVLKRMYEDIDIYDNTIQAFTIDFLSPVADGGPLFYMYFIRDTVVEAGVKLVNLDFAPRNPEDLLFRGVLQITLDGNYAIRKAELGISKGTNLNYVRDFHIRQYFQQGPGERYHLATSDMIAHFSPFPRSPSIYAERQVTISRLSDSVLSDSVLRGFSPDTSYLVIHGHDPFPTEVRRGPLSGPEEKTYANTDSLLKMRSYRRLMDWVTVLSVGYKSAGKFDIGPVGNFYSFNPVEGSKFQFGGRSNTKLSTRYFTEAYIAYGVKDQRWKYFVSGTYSINNKSIYTYPFHYLQMSFQHDTRYPGQAGIFGQGGNAFLSSFSRSKNDKLLYNDILRISNVHEFGDHFSYLVGMKYWNQQPAGSLTYVYENVPGKPDTVRHLRSSELSATLRWAPHEQFLQNKVGRTGITNKYPVISLQYARGIDGLFGGQFPYNALHLNVLKRWYLAPLGYSDITFDAEYLGGNLPFPLLVIHPSNNSYFYSFYTYNLMNTEEFVSDHYASLNIDHYFNGFFFNKIPLLKKLRLREVIAAKVLYGGLRRENNPVFNPRQMHFPLDNGVTATYELGDAPYVEASVGIYNIFSFIRLDLIKRFTYLDHPGISQLGLRVSTDFHF